MLQPQGHKIHQLEEIIYGPSTVIDLNRFHMNHREMNELVIATVDWLKAVGMPRPNSPAGSVLEILKRCYIEETESKGPLQ